MDFIIYLIKVNIAIVILYGFYRLFLQRDTLFACKRFVLLGIFGIALLYPTWDISQQLIERWSVEQAIRNGEIMGFSLREVIIGNENIPEQTAFFSLGNLPQLLFLLYIIGVGVLSLWFLSQMASIVYIISRARKTIINGQNIFVREGLKAPFSFFGYIVMDPDRYTEEELQEILDHEQTHCDQRHSLDVLISELCCVFCWFNPFAWLMKQEVRINLEYLADRAVLESGHNSEHYQLHLVRLSYHKAIAKFTNNFNVSPLKKRIIMMNKQKTSVLGFAKYALFLPLVGGLLCFNTLDVIGSTTPTEEVEIATVSQERVVASVTGVEQSEKKIYNEVEVPPNFPGGMAELLKYLQTNIVYPKEAAEQGIQGSVVVRFVVNADGKVTDVTLLRSVEKHLDEEALRAVRAMPDWEPGKLKGETVSVYFTLPVYFSLPKEK